MSSRRRMTTIALAFGIVLGSIGVASPAVAAPSYPSWDDVQAARGNETAKQAEIDRITTLIATLQSSADDAAIVAQQAGEAYQVAVDLQSQAQARSDALATELADARTTADSSAKQVGSLLARMGRTSGTDVTLSLIADSGNADDLLYKLGAINKVTEQSAVLLDKARQDANKVTAVSGQADVAADVLTKASEEAEKKLDAANAAATTAQAAVTEQQSHEDELYGQLEFLKNNVTTVEQAYQAGAAARAAAAAEAAARGAAKAAAAAAAAAAANKPPASSGGGGGGGASSGGGAPLSGTAAAQSAVAFAKAQLGDWYVFGGEGPNTWDCSGLTMIAYRQAGVSIGAHTVGAQYRYLTARGRLAPVSGGLVPGDLLFYSPGSTTNSQQMYHVTIYVGGGMMIEAPEPGKQVQMVPMRTLRLVPYVGRPTG